MDGYNNFTKNCINSKGIIYPFTGLRGDAKQLWRQIKIMKNESRVELVKANTYSLQKTAIKHSDVVIWACGYESNHVPVMMQNPLTNKLEPIDFKKTGIKQYEVDDNLKIINKGSSKNLNVFGIGLGYSIKTSNKHIKAEKNLNSRADGVRLYGTIVPYILFPYISMKKMENKGK